jgi:uncharacterized protein
MAARLCPICKRPVVAEHLPFCSERCRDVDLGRWLNGDYRAPGPPIDPEDLPRPVPEPDEA